MTVHVARLLLLPSPDHVIARDCRFWFFVSRERPIGIVPIGRFMLVAGFARLILVTTLNLK